MGTVKTLISDNGGTAVNRSMYFGVVIFFGLASLTCVAHADGMGQGSLQGYYLRLTAGALGIMDADSTIPGDGDRSVTEYDIGYRVGGAIGYHLNDNFGVEVEGAHASADPNHLTLYGDPNSDNFQMLNNKIWSTSASGEARADTLMFNFIYRHPWAGLTPYIGIGGGMAWMKSKTSFNYPPALPAKVPVTFEDTDETWSAQGFIGVDKALTSNLSVGVRYRAQGIGDFDLLNNLIKIDKTLWHSGELTLEWAF